MFCNLSNFFIFVFLPVAMMSVLVQVRLRSTSLQMTHLLTHWWTPVRGEQSRRNGLATPLQILPHTAERPQPVLPGFLPPTTHWDCKSRSINILHLSPSHWRQHHLMSQCCQSRDSPSLSCHVTFINTNQRGGMMATPSNSLRTRSHRTVNLFLSPVGLVN